MNQCLWCGVKFTGIRSKYCSITCGEQYRNSVVYGAAWRDGSLVSAVDMEHVLAAFGVTK